MVDGDLAVPERPALKRHVLESCHEYWRREPKFVDELPIPELSFPDIVSPLRLKSIALPDWAESCSVSGCLLVPAEACRHGIGWQQVDWWLACFLLMEGWHERSHERRHGSIHSYSFRLKDWDARVWRRAWVNRIAIFLRLWAAESQKVDADSLFGPIPPATITMTHDVDAVTKTVPIRLKQTAFNLLNVMRQLFSGQWRDARRSIRRAARFMFSRENWWVFDDLLAIEEGAGIRSRFHFYADGRRKTLTRWLLDPGYDITNDRMRRLINRLDAGGWRTGLHQSYDAWRSGPLIREQRERLGTASSSVIDTCRQHWLRFGWGDTWAAQETAGLREDTTLMFNDRMGFRSAAALAWNPWNPRVAQAHDVRAVPTVLMDSHAYDYCPMTDDERRSEIRHWLAELKKVGGRCAVLWHPHTLTDDYGWLAGYHDCIDLAVELDICVSH